MCLFFTILCVFYYARFTFLISHLQWLLEYWRGMEGGGEKRREDERGGKEDKMIR